MILSNIYIYLLILIFLSSNVIAASNSNQFAICKPLTELAPHPPNLSPVTGDNIQVFANDATYQEKIGISTFSGNVVVQRQDQILKANTVIYNTNNEIVDAKSNFTFWNKDFIIQGSKAQIRPNDQAEMDLATYWLLTRRARGYAKKLTQVSKDIVRLERATYTTCDPQNEFWRMEGRKIMLDQAKEIGIARDVKLRILGVPVFYTPYISFPLTDKRKSGFLFPQIGNSDETGTEFNIPYYINLAPNYDLTVTPRIMSRRGFLLNSELRYLTEKNEGKLEIEYLPYDLSLQRERGSIAFLHNGAITDRLSSNIFINHVSDQRYFEELGSNITIASITHLEQRADLYYSGNGWMGLGRVQKFQVLDPNPAARPYQRLPQLMLQTMLPEYNRRLNIGMKAELVRFDRDTEVIKGAIGNRIDFKSIFSYPWRTPGAFVIPTLAWRYTHYDLDHTEPNDEAATYNRMLFTATADSGLFLERPLNIFGKNLIQTLEPRVFYRYAPYRDQSEIPIFDTAAFELSYLQLFREENLSGPDRIEDGHRISVGISSRLLNGDTGLEHLRFSIGQYRYLNERRVSLPNQALPLEDNSSVVMELASEFAKDWRISSTFRWNPNTQNTEYSVWRLQYNPDNEHILNFSYRFRDNVLDQTDTSFIWSLGSRWNILGRVNYSLPDEKTLESFAGIEYRSCCWALRAITRRYLNNIDGFGYYNGFFLQLQLTGLGKIGKKSGIFLQESIPGFYDNF